MKLKPYSLLLFLAGGCATNPTSDPNLFTLSTSQVQPTPLTFKWDYATNAFGMKFEVYHTTDLPDFTFYLITTNKTFSIFPTNTFEGFIVRTIDTNGLKSDWNIK